MTITRIALNQAISAYNSYRDLITAEYYKKYDGYTAVISNQVNLETVLTVFHGDVEFREMSPVKDFFHVPSLMREGLTKQEAAGIIIASEELIGRGGKTASGHCVQSLRVSNNIGNCGAFLMKDLCYKGYPDAVGDFIQFMSSMNRKRLVTFNDKEKGNILNLLEFPEFLRRAKVVGDISYGTTVKNVNSGSNILSGSFIVELNTVSTVQKGWIPVT